MSELKAFESERIYWSVEQVEREAGDIDSLHLEDNLFYIKSEADKVIENKDREIEEQKRLRDMALASVPNVLKVMKIIQHHKHKRCLAMAKWCMTEYIQSKCLDFTNTEQWYWRRWNIRWRNLAEKFKDGK